MIQQYKKGDVLLVTYTLPNHAHIMKCVGIMYSLSDIEIELVHNFSGTSPIDTTKILLRKITTVEKIEPIEINSLDELRF